MKIKIVQDSVVFISGLTKEQFVKAKRFVPEALTLKAKNAEGKEEPVCVICYADEGGVSKNGIVFDSTTDDGKMCYTLTMAQGCDPHTSAEEKVRLITEEYSGLILKMNNLESQVLDTVADKESEISAAETAVEIINL